MCKNTVKDQNKNEVQVIESAVEKRLYMDEAISKTNFGVFNYLLIFLSGLILFAAIVEVDGIMYVFPVSQCDLHLSPSQKGMLGGAAPIGIICSSYLWGYLADTKGRRAGILPSLFIAFFLSVGASFSQNFYLFLTLRFLNGFFISGSAATIYAYLGEFHNDAQRSRAIMGAAAIFCVSCLLLPLIAWGVINQDWRFEVPLLGITYKPWRFYFVVCSLPEIIAGLVFIFLPESPRFVLDQGDNAKAYEILQKVNRWNNECKNSKFPILKSIWIQTAPLFNSTYLRSTILICLLQFGLYVTGHGFFMFFGQIVNKMALNVGNFVDDRMMMCDVITMQPKNVTATNFGKVDEEVCVEKLELETLGQGAAVEAIYAGGQILIALLISKTGNYPIIFFILVLCGSCGVLCVLVDIPFIQVNAFTILLSSGLALNVVNSVAVESYPTAIKAMAMSVSSMCGRLGGVVGANMTALLLDHNCTTLFYLCSISLYVLAILAFFIPNIHKNKANVPRISVAPRLSMVSYRGVV